MPRFFIDLNLDQIVYKINSLRKNYDVRKLYYMLSDSEKTLSMRRGVYEDFKNNLIFDSFSLFSDFMKQTRDYISYSDEVDFEPQKAVLFVTAAGCYCSAVDSLKALEGRLSSDRLIEVINQLTLYSEKPEYVEFKNRAEQICEELSNMVYRLVITRDNFTVNGRKGDGCYFQKIKRAFPDAKDVGFESPFSHRKTLSHIETDSHEIVSKSNPDLIRKCKDFMVEYSDFCKEELKLLEYEAQLYISFDIFRKYMEENGFGFTSPVTSKTMDCDNVYDIALAISLFGHERSVVDNNVTMDEGENFLVVTGPNQGGKTTFARSVGQMIYFSQMGLMVAAKEARIPYYDGILTHFSVEESTETGQGKLKEELTRLSPMMKGDDKNCFIILNELFTTAATYDAGVMGKRVIDYFSDKGCKGIYVTHIKELTTITGTVSLVAVCDENDYHKRLYKMVRKPADGIGYAGTLVEKYALTYEDLISRFDNRGLTGGEK